MKVYYNSKLAKRLLFGNFKTCMFFGTVITKLAQLSAPSDTRASTSASFGSAAY